MFDRAVAIRTLEKRLATFFSDELKEHTDEAVVYGILFTQLSQMRPNCTTWAFVVHGIEAMRVALNLHDEDDVDRFYWLMAMRDVFAVGHQIYHHPEDATERWYERVNLSLVRSFVARDELIAKIQRERELQGAQDEMRSEFLQKIFPTPEDAN